MLRWSFVLLLVLVLPLLLAGGALLLNGAPLAEPPGAGARLKAYLGTHVAETRPDHPFPELRSRSYPLPAPVLHEKLEEAMRSLGWQEIRSEPRTLRVEAVVITPWLGFRDDLLAQVQPEGGNSRLYLRSESRVGRGDLGANRGHIMALYRALEALTRGG